MEFWGGGLGPPRLLLQVGETYRPCWAPGADPGLPPGHPCSPLPWALRGPLPRPLLPYCVVTRTPLPLCLW